MSAGRGQLTPAQNEIFHENYEYMWKKLSTTYYQVSQNPEKCRGIRGREYLPSYAYLCKCTKIEYVPTLSTVNKIVDFYNVNIVPKVSSYQFINESLSAQDAMRYRIDDCRCADRIAGIYYGYYMSSGENGRISGAIMSIYTCPGGEGGEKRCRVHYVTGIHSEELLHDERLLDFMRESSFDKDGFDRYCDGAAKEYQSARLWLYEGEVEISSRWVFMDLQGITNSTDRMCIAIDISLFVNANEGELSGIRQANGRYIGGMAMVMKLNSSVRACIHAFLLGLARAELGALPHMSENEKEIVRFLRVRTEDSRSGRLQINAAQDQKWYSYLVGLQQRAKRSVKTQMNNKG